MSTCRNVLVTFVLLLASSLVAQSSLTTSVMAGNQGQGTMFDITSLTNVAVSGFAVTLPSGQTTTLEIWTLTAGGSYLGQQTNPAAWTLIASAGTVTGAGPTTPVMIPANLNVPMPSGTTRGFYVTTTNGTTMFYSNGAQQGLVFAQNVDLQVREGHAGFYPFNVNTTPRRFNGRVHYTPLAAQDLSLTSILAPNATTTWCDRPTATEAVQVGMMNTGSLPLAAGTSLPFSVFKGGMLIAAESFNLPLTLFPGQTTSYTFTATLDLQSVGTHAISISHSWAPDQVPANNLVTKAIVTQPRTVVTAFPYLEDFDSLTGGGGSTTPPAGWEQSATDGGGLGNAPDWTFPGAAAPSSGPSSDHTTGLGRYAFLEDNGSHHPAVVLATPCLDLSGLANPAVSFWVFSQNLESTPSLHQNSLHIDGVAYPGGTVFLDIAPPIGHQSGGWAFQAADLTPFAGMLMQVRFRGTTNGGGALHSLAIDDVEIRDLVLANGQAPQPGLATFEVNQSLDPNGFPFLFGDPGPYRADARSGQAIEFRFSGVPTSPIILLSGPTNAGLVAYPGIGQIDIGTGVDPVTSFAQGLTIHANGTTPAFPHLFFVLGTGGSQFLSFPTPNLPLGLLTTFQAIIFNGGPSVISISNAVEVYIVP
ncbi:MAG: hypothetical protein KDB53_05150 [Planctomycetes bacterium]|nr:hypothetical protein [Planctomycetota bacterium]